MKKALLVVFTIWALSALSQGEMTLPMMEHVYQSTYYNPAAVPDHKVSIGLPGISSLKFGLINTGFQPLGGFDKQNGVSVFNIDKFIRTMPNNNYLHFGGQVDLFHLRVKWRNSFVSFDAGNITEINMNIPKALFPLMTLDWADPATEQGRSFDLSSFNLRMLSYNHYSFGLNKMLRNFNIGARINLLQGLVSAVGSSDNTRIDVSTDAIALNGSASAYTSGISNATSAQFSAVDLATQFSNLGASADLGITYKFREKLFLGASANNIGFIDWKSNIENTKFYQEQTKGPFQGINAFPQILRGDTSANSSIMDSVANYFSTGSDSSIKRQSYRTWLIPRVYANVTYKITKKLSVTAMVKFEKYIEWRYAMMLGAQYKVGRVLSLTASTTYQYGNFTLGAGLMLKPGPFQFYIVTDNIPTTFYPLKVSGATYTVPLDLKMVNIRVGMNLVFGRIFDPRKQALNFK